MYKFCSSSNVPNRNPMHCNTFKLRRAKREKKIVFVVDLNRNAMRFHRNALVYKHSEAKAEKNGISLGYVGKCVCERFFPFYAESTSRKEMSVMRVFSA